MSGEAVADVVALLAEGVGRNSFVPDILSILRVALLAEGVGRNNFGIQVKYVHCLVALLAEGVGRNRIFEDAKNMANASPSSRRAWVEIIRLFPLGSASVGRPPRGGRG